MLEGGRGYKGFELKIPIFMGRRSFGTSAFIGL